MEAKNCKKGAGCTCITTVDQQIEYYGKQASSKEYDTPLISYVDELSFDRDELKKRYDRVLDKYNTYLIMEGLLKECKTPEVNLLGNISIMYAAEILGEIGLGTLANDLNAFAQPSIRKKLWADRLLKASSAKGSISRKEEQGERNTLVKEGMRSAFIDSNNIDLKFKAMLQILEKDLILECSVSETKTVYTDRYENEFSERTLRRIFNSLKQE